MTNRDRPGSKAEVRAVLEGDHPCTLLVGSGLHHYLKAKGVKYVRPKGSQALFNWSELLKSIDGSGAPPRHADSTAIWESIVAKQCAAHPVNSPRDHEGYLLRNVRSTLLRASPPSTDKSLRKFGHALRNSGVRSVVTLNFDRTLDRALARNGAAYPVARPACSDVGGYRARLHVDADGLRVWHAHGMAETQVRYQSIQLGLVEYAESVAALSRLYSDYRKRRADWLRARDEPRGDSDRLRYWPPGAFASWTAEAHRDGESWLDNFLSSHVIVVGCGLSPAEIDIWYALHARQRELASVPENERPQTFYLHPWNSFPSHLTTRPAGLRPVITDTFDDAWSIILGS